MKIVDGKLYFLKNLFFDKYNKKYKLLDNEKNTKTKRPSYFCITDDKNKDILWFIPLSKQYDKYQSIYKNKIEKRYKSNKKYPINNFVFCENIADCKSVFLIQNIFPICKKYIKEEYKRNKQPIYIPNQIKKEVLTKTMSVLADAKDNKDFTTFTKPLSFKIDIEQELLNENKINDFLNNKNIDMQEEIINVIENTISKEDLSLYFENVNDKFVKKDLDRIINTSEELGKIKRELNTYISVFSSHIIQASETLQVNSNLKDINLLVAIFNKAHNEKVANYVIKMLDSIEDIDYDILYKDKVIESNIQYCNNIINNRKIIADYYNENEENYIIKDIIDIVDNSETKFELKEYSKTISENRTEYKKELDKLDYDKPLDDLKDAIVDIINRPPLSLNNDEEEDER